MSAPSDPAPVVDAHVHLLPGRLGEKVRQFFLQGFRPEELYPLDHGAILERLGLEPDPAPADQ